MFLHLIQEPAMALWPHRMTAEIKFINYGKENKKHIAELLISYRRRIKTMTSWPNLELKLSTSSSRPE